MKALYLESSAVAAWLFGEAAAADVIRAMNQAEVRVTSALTAVEAERAIHRAVAQRLVKEAMAHKLRGALERERASWITMSLTTSVLGGVPGSGDSRARSPSLRERRRSRSRRGVVDPTRCPPHCGMIRARLSCTGREHG